MIPLTGYADRLSVRPGETISFHVSHQHHHSSDADEKPLVSAKIVRVICADPHAEDAGGPGIQLEPLLLSTNNTSTLECVQEPGPCTTQMGSYAVIALPQDIWQLQEEGVTIPGFTFMIHVMPTLKGVRQTIASCRGIFELFLDQQGRLNATFGLSSSSSSSITEEEKFGGAKSVPLNQWSQVWCVCDTTSGTVGLGHQLITNSSQRLGIVAAKSDSVFQRVGTLLAFSLDSEPLTLAAAFNEDKSVQSCFNGRLERPQLWTSSMFGSGGETTSDRYALLLENLQSTPPYATWDFSQEMTTQTIIDVSKHSLHGKLVNTPTRAVRGSNWSGREMCWRYAPGEYGAIHFHSTDLSDCNWPVSYRWTVPFDLKSGNYALLLESGEQHKDNIPFFVVPPKGQKQADLAVIISTFTYVIYGNHARSEWVNEPKWRDAWKQQVQEHQAYPYHPREHPEYGWSTYNNHGDGTGISIASYRRPMLNFRVGYITFPYPEINGSGLRHYPADTHLTTWLEAQGISYDVITDWELHTEGYEVLKPYRVVTTGTHPEYHTEESLQALYDYRGQGGRLMYLGGNGFYWKIAIKDEILEIRRGEGGIRAWASEPGEYYHQLDGQYGGLWRRSGRAPQALAGVGFTAQGIFTGSYYKVKPEAMTNPRTNWMFQGIVDSDALGNHGLSGHGAAGFELDRTDITLGTPEHAAVVASSKGHSPESPWILVFEEKLTHLGNLPGAPDEELIRADLTFFETPSGGAVFSTGSITFCGSLLTNACQNDISQLIKNVMLKFLDPNAGFTMPA